MCYFKVESQKIIYKKSLLKYDGLHITRPILILTSYLQTNGHTYIAKI